MKTLFVLIAGVLSFLSLFGQATGTIDYKHLGLTFTIPDGWVGQEAEMGYVMGSNSVPGLILILPHDQSYTVPQLRAQAQAGLNEGNGTNLQPVGTLAELGSNAIGGEFSGTLEWQPARAYIIGMSNTYGLGITIISVTTAENYSDQYPRYAKAVQASVKFRQPESKEDIGEWKKWLGNVKLTYRESYNSISPGVDGMTGGGYSLRREIDLCAAGYFNYYGSSNVSMGSDNSSAYSRGSSGGNGTWDIRVAADGNPLLVLNFNDGSTSSYTLTYENEKLYLNGTRYFRTMQGEYAPNCN